MNPEIGIPENQRFWPQAKSWYRTLKAALAIVAIVGAALVLGQAYNLYRLAADIHPILGYTVLAGLATALIYAIGRPIQKYLAQPRIAEPPAFPENHAPTAADVLRLQTYLGKVLDNAMQNPHLAETRGQAFAAKAELQTLAQNGGSEPATQEKWLADWADRTMPEIWKPVEKKVDQLIHREALAVGIATAISPNGTLDAYLMLWRSSAMVGDIAALYYGRPGFWESCKVIRDVAAATAVAGTLQSVSDSLGNFAVHSVGGVTGVLAGPVTDGITNALVLTRIGYLAQARCRSYRPWTPTTQKNALLGAISATRKVAFGLTGEILRQAGAGLGAVAGAAASSVADVAEHALNKVNSAARNLATAATGLGGAIRNRIFGSDPQPGNH